MKILFVLLLAVSILFCISTLARASVLTFDSPVTPGLTLGGRMEWNDTGGGHVFMNASLGDDYMEFISPTMVNSFQMNGLPWEGYSDWLDEIDLIRIAAFTSASTQVWEREVDLRGYKTWDRWLTVPVNIDNITTMVFYATGTSKEDLGFWPSVDNMVINETSAVPEPATLLLLGSGLLGLLGFRKKLRYNTRSAR